MRAARGDRSRRAARAAARGSVALLSAEGDLSSGDTLAHGRRAAASPLYESIDDCRKSLARIKAMAVSLRTVYPGHGRPFPAAELAAVEL
jgi:glyoxylase-like metal-dependent hydrolase (beta-lactamase superfamily II)